MLHCDGSGKARLAGAGGSDATPQQHLLDRLTGAARPDRGNLFAGPTFLQAYANSVLFQGRA
jgi:hypothetical protein